jgi:hypothetical protein
MGQLVKWELKRFTKKKHILIICLLLIAFNTYFINYEFKFFKEHVFNSILADEGLRREAEAMEGRITPEKIIEIEGKLKEVRRKSEEGSFKSENEGHSLILNKMLYDAYLNYANSAPYPLNHKGINYDNKKALVDRLEKYKSEKGSGAFEYKELKSYLDLTEGMKKDRFYIMGANWNSIFKPFMGNFVMIVIIISMAMVFGEDYSGNTAALTLSSRYGRTKLVRARIISSTIFGAVIFSSFYLSELLVKTVLYGIRGHQGRVSQLGFIYLSDLTAAKQLIVFFGFYLAAALVLTALVLAISLLTKKTLSTIIAVILINLIAGGVRTPVINNFNYGALLNSFNNSLVNYNPLNLFGRVLHYPVYLMLWLVVVCGFALSIVMYKGERQHI